MKYEWKWDPSMQEAFGGDRAKWDEWTREMDERNAKSEAAARADPVMSAMLDKLIKQFTRTAVKNHEPIRRDRQALNECGCVLCVRYLAELDTRQQFDHLLDS